MMSTKESEIEDVLIQVRGGIAKLVHAPENVNVVIHDLDDCEDDEWRQEHCTICTPDVPVVQGEAPTLTAGKKIPRFRLWWTRYCAYRHKYGRWLAFWRGVVLSEMYVLGQGILEDEKDMMQHLIHIELAAAELVIRGPEGEEIRVDLMSGSDQEVKPGE